MIFFSFILHIIYVCYFKNILVNLLTILYSLYFCETCQNIYFTMFAKTKRECSTKCHR